MLKNLLFTGFVLVFLIGESQNDSITFFTQSSVIKKNRLIGVAGAEIVGYSATMIGLNTLWYKDYPKSKFHFFNDNKEWLQMDKIGHATTAYYVGYLGMKSMQWSGVNNNKSLWFGGTLGLLFLTSIEVFDGYSAAWGASSGDLLSNTAGFLLLAGQQIAWEEQRIMLKYSVHFTDYAKFRPNILGNSWSEQLLKDYNGQTYWLSVNLASFLADKTKLPKWLNLAIGYSGEGMIGGHENPIYDSEGNMLPNFKRYRQYLLSLDIDLTRIKTKSKFINTALSSFGFIKFPLPALEYNSLNGVKGHFLYF